MSLMLAAVLLCLGSIPLGPLLKKEMCLYSLQISLPQLLYNKLHISFSISLILYGKNDEKNLKSFLSFYHAIKTYGPMANFFCLALFLLLCLYSWKSLFYICFSFVLTLFWVLFEPFYFQVLLILISIIFKEIQVEK